MSTIKKERLNTTILRELSLILRDEVKDPLVKNVTITEVSCTNDLSIAKVYLSFRDHPKRTLEALEHSKGFIRKKLSQRIKIRKCPELQFLKDEALEYGNHIEDLLRNLNK